jgi:hypothetical protein
MRDDEQHWIAIVNEGLLYLHARACVTLFDEILLDVFQERLADHLPERVLPISTRPPADIDVLIDEQFDQVKKRRVLGNAEGPRLAACCAGS